MMIRNGKLPHSLTYYSHRALQTSGQEHNSSIILTVFKCSYLLACLQGLPLFGGRSFVFAECNTHFFNPAVVSPPPLLPRSGSSITLSTVPYQSPVSPVSTTTTTHRCRHSKESG